MERLTHDHHLQSPSVFFLLLSLISAVAALAQTNLPAPPVRVHVGVVLDVNSWNGRRQLTSINMALDDFYSSHGTFKTKLVLHLRDCQTDVICAASVAADLVNNVQVQAIIGPQASAQAEFVAGLGSKAQVPVISFSATSPSLSAERTPYFIRTTLNDSSQVPAIAAVVQHFRWREVVAVYEDTAYGAGVIPYLTDTLQSVDVKVPYRSVFPPSASDDQLLDELHKLRTIQTRVFIVHMTAGLAVQLFRKAAELGMMCSGYVWIVTDGVANLLDIMNPTDVATMNGLIGVRPSFPCTKKLTKFSVRWKERFRRDNPSLEVKNLTMLQLWAYDTVQALAIAAETARLAGVPDFKVNTSSANNAFSINLAQIGASQTGPRLLAAIRATKFNGVSGEFKLVDGQLSSAGFEILNVDRECANAVGSWTPVAGISKLSRVVWPGNFKEVPRGWQIPTGGNKLRVGVPAKNGFNEFVNVSHDPITKTTNVTGYCIDVFEAVMKALPYDVPYEFIPIGDPSKGKFIQSYDELIYQVYLNDFDVLVGDTTIVANRSLYVDFTQPFTESGVRMIVPMREEKSKNMWIFTEPLTKSLWLSSLAFFFFTGIVAWAIERRINDEFRGSSLNQLGTMFYFSFSTLVFAHREKLNSNLSRVLVIVWLFVVLVLTQSYTASLTSMLTAEKLQPAVDDMNELLKNGDYIGYQGASFVKGLLKGIGFDEHKLRNYSTSDQYAEALSRGSANGGVAAFFDEIPYLKVFLKKHCHAYSMVGHTYKTDGFGFAFPRGSPMVSDVSRAILSVTEGKKMVEIGRKWFGDQSDWVIDQNKISSSSSLQFENFGGLFLISGVASSLSLSVFFITKAYKKWKELRAVAIVDSVRKIVAWAGKFRGTGDGTGKVPTFGLVAAAGAAYGGGSVTDINSSDDSDVFSSPERSSTENHTDAEQQRV